MEEQKEKQMNVDVVNTTEGQSEMEQRTEVRTEEHNPPTNDEDFAPLFENDEAEEFRSHWLNIQSRFVDDPRASVKEADELVANVIKSITRSFADRRISLENQWNGGENNISTEDMRDASLGRP